MKVFEVSSSTFHVLEIEKKHLFVFVNELGRDQRLDSHKPVFSLLSLERKKHSCCLNNKLLLKNIIIDLETSMT